MPITEILSINLMHFFAVRVNLFYVCIPNIIDIVVCKCHSLTVSHFLSISFTVCIYLFYCILLLLSASPYSGSPQRDSNLHFTRSTLSPSLAPTLSMPSPWPSSFPSAWHCHLHHPFPHVVFY